ncbi:glycoside hydrolase family 68 protein [Aurantiacibacter poecillastricola]|uniref:glycoside hydrolase family 68 protein n=1 Tax=Aurantiacibacter poecillastricola TaxID=3064385 RepID=UPI00273FC9C6|nr:glycoside hydrolase family 68 protein [Aurantiacibacter sp. 219JJ12-13]MDP5263030.1 glycoside hydrolase family 68 protein [Aurantiacibacter sp. 219JJ12-13]
MPIGITPASSVLSSKQEDQPSPWRAPASGHFETDATSTAPLIAATDFARISADLDIWDAWPVQLPDGHPAKIGDGSTLWMALAAPRFDDPEERHGHARIHLLQRIDGGWTDLGPAMPDGFSPGSREWSGSAVLDPAMGVVTLYFTATGQRGEAELSFSQRIFRARADLQAQGGVKLAHWRDLEEIVVRDPAHYMDSEGGEGRIGTIKAFRDPAYFLDPADGRSHLLFAASAENSASRYNGVVGMATARDDRLDTWQTAAPIISADGLNNELERPHAIYHGGLYYVFWSTQSHVFDPDGPVGPTGLYGMVAESLHGPWQALNGTGLVFANPAAAPSQAYSWLVMPDMKVISFVDDWGGCKNMRRFGATFAPDLLLELDGKQAKLVT